MQHLRDTVHLMRHIIRLFDEAVREVTLDVPKGLPYKERKKQLKLKRRLLRKQLRPLLTVAATARKGINSASARAGVNQGAFFIVRPPCQLC